MQSASLIAQIGVCRAVRAVLLHPKRCRPHLATRFPVQTSVFFRKIFPKKSTNVFFWENGAKRRDFFWDFLRSFLGKSARSADFSKKNQIWAKTFFFGKKSGFFGVFWRKNVFFWDFFWENSSSEKNVFFGKITKTLKKTLVVSCVAPLHPVPSQLQY